MTIDGCVIRELDINWLFSVPATFLGSSLGTARTRVQGIMIA